MINFLILGNRGSEAVFENFEFTEICVFAGVKHRFIIIGPGGNTRGIGDCLGKGLPGNQVFKMQGIFSPAHIIHSIDYQGVIRADAETPHPVIRIAFGHPVDIQHDLLCAVHAPFSAAVYGVFFPGLVTGIVVIPIVLIGDGGILLFYSPGNFVE